MGVGRAGRVTGKGTGSGEKDADGEERRTGIPREPKRNKIIQKTGEEKQNKMDKQKKNRKPVNQGKSYVCPGADLYHAPHRPGNVGGNLLVPLALFFSSWMTRTLLGCSRYPSPIQHKPVCNSQGCV